MAQATKVVNVSGNGMRTVYICNGPRCWHNSMAQAQKCEARWAAAQAKLAAKQAK